MFRPPTKYSEYLQDVRKSIDYILKRVNATTVTKIVAGTNVTISPASGTGVVTINASGGGGGGLPAGGTTGQILAKINNVDYNAEWIDNYALWTSTVKHEVKAGEAINKGQAVYVSSADGTNMIVSKASNALEATSSKTLGILAQSLAHNAKGFVITEGLLAGLDTSAAGAAGDPVWLGTDGNLLFGLANKPYAPANMVSIGVVTRKNSSNGEIFVRIQNGFELDELHNVDARNPNNNDGIFYNSTTQLWEHKPVSAVYATPTLAQVTTAGNTTTNAITVGGLTVATNLIVTDTVNGRINFGDTTTSDSAVSFRFTKNSTTEARLGVYGSNKLGVYLGLVGNNAAIYAYNYTAGAAVPLILNGFGGNVLINTTTDAGYKLDVNGIARVVTRIDAGSFSPGAGATAYTFATTGRITAAGGYNLRSPITGDSTFSGLGDNSGPTIYNNNTTVVRFATVGGTLNGTNVDILQGYNPGAGTGTVVGFKHSYVLYPSADNTVSYTSFLSNPNWNSAPFYNRITGPIRGFYFVNGLYNTQKLVDVIAFQSAGGRVLFEGELPSASAGISRGVYINQTHTASANNDVLVGLDINPTFTNGAFTGVSNLALRVAYIPSRHISFTQRPGYADYGRIQFTNVTGADIYSSGRIDLIPSDASQTVGLGNTITSQRLAASTNWGLYSPSPPGFSVGGNAAFGFLSNNADGNTDSFVFAGPTGARHFFKVVQNNVPYFTIMPTGNVLINTTTDSGYKLDVVGADSRFNGVRVGIGAGGVSTNTVVGNGALALNTTGDNLIAIGSALVKNTTGVQNIGIGNLSLRENTTGSYNTAIGYWAGFGISTGSQNTLLGRYAGNGITTGSSNVAIGMNSLYNSATAPNNNVSIGTTAMQNGSGDNNIAIGTGVLYNNTASNNTAVGYQAGLSNTTGTLNTLIGHSAGYNNTTAVGTTAVGHRSLYTNSTGSENTGVGEYALQANSTGNQNVSVGAQSMFLNNTGSDNTAVGFRALQLVTSSNNTAVGSDSLQNTTTGGNNVSVGRQSLLSNSTGNYNTALGFQAGYAGVANTTGSNNIFIGYQATGVSATESNRTWIGNSSTTSTWLAGNVLIGTTTDAGYKLDVNGTVRAQVSLSGIPNIIHVSNLQTDGGPGGAIAFYTGGVVGNASRITAQRSGPVGQSDIALETNGVTRLFVSVLGNIGLGTTNPTDKFHIVDNTNGNKFGRISAGGTDASAAWVAQNDQVDNIVYRVFGSAVTGSQMGQALARSASLIANLGGTGKFLIGSFSGTDLIFGTSDQARMRLVDATGNFLIGTMTDTGNKLTVSGNIDAQGYKVNNVLGYTGIFNVPTNPPGQQNIDIQGGIVINIF